MRCPNCGSPNAEDAFHCPYCGQRLRATRLSRIGVLLAALLFIVFLPVGACGAFFIFLLTTSPRESDRSFALIPCTIGAIGAIVAYVTYRFLRKEMM